MTPLPHSDAPDAELRSRGLAPSPWSARAGAVFAAHAHDQTKHLYVVRGTIGFTGPFGSIELAAGDGILIDAGTVHAAVAGTAGVTCVEAFEA